MNEWRRNGVHINVHNWCADLCSLNGNLTHWNFLLFIGNMIQAAVEQLNSRNMNREYKPRWNKNERVKLSVPIPSAWKFLLVVLDWVIAYAKRSHIIRNNRRGNTNSTNAISSLALRYSCDAAAAMQPWLLFDLLLYGILCVFVQINLHSISHALNINNSIRFRPNMLWFCIQMEFKWVFVWCSEVNLQFVVAAAAVKIRSFSIQQWALITNLNGCAHCMA